LDVSSPGIDVLLPLLAVEEGARSSRFPRKPERDNSFFPLFILNEYAMSHVCSAILFIHPIHVIRKSIALSNLGLRKATMRFCLEAASGNGSGSIAGRRTQDSSSKFQIPRNEHQGIKSQGLLLCPRVWIAKSHPRQLVNLLCSRPTTDVVSWFQVSAFQGFSLLPWSCLCGSKDGGSKPAAAKRRRMRKNTGNPIIFTADHADFTDNIGAGRCPLRADSFSDGMSNSLL
jgi:hypothetical protein